MNMKSPRRYNQRHEGRGLFQLRFFGPLVFSDFSGVTAFFRLRKSRRASALVFRVRCQFSEFALS